MWNWNYGEAQPPTPFLEAALPPTPPDTWDQRVERVRWVLSNFTDGEKAYLYRILYEGDGLRIAQTKEIERKEKRKLR